MEPVLVPETVVEPAAYLGLLVVLLLLLEGPVVPGLIPSHVVEPVDFFYLFCSFQQYGNAVQMIMKGTHVFLFMSAIPFFIKGTQFQ